MPRVLLINNDNIHYFPSLAALRRALLAAAAALWESSHWFSSFAVVVGAGIALATINQHIVRRGWVHDDFRHAAGTASPRGAPRREGSRARGAFLFGSPRKKGCRRAEAVAVAFRKKLWRFFKLVAQEATTWMRLFCRRRRAPDLLDFWFFSFEAAARAHPNNAANKCINASHTCATHFYIATRVLLQQLHTCFDAGVSISNNAVLHQYNLATWISIPYVLC